MSVVSIWGCFDTPEGAARTYNNAAQKHHGEFTKLNELDDETSTLILNGMHINGPRRRQQVRHAKPSRLINL
jgi:hypothetical protein